jgi:predicted CoA-substrate-specific enzyme activase
MTDDKKLFAGVDVGSLTAEALIIDQDGKTIASTIIRVRPRPEQSARDVFDKALHNAGLAEDQISLCFSTGYGRDSISFSAKNISEISCHGRGAHYLAPSIRTVIDVGGQDCKIIRVDNSGYLEDFVMNDKCAAGTGRFLEMMSQTLGVDISELGALAAGSKKPLALSSICTIFAELEVMQLLYSKKKRKHIAAGIHVSLARRIKSLVGRVGLADKVCMTGGVSKNTRMVQLLEHELGVTFQNLPMDPQLVGALGAALFARDARQRGDRNT